MEIPSSISFACCNANIKTSTCCFDKSQSLVSHPNVPNTNVNSLNGSGFSKNISVMLPL
jgi:hypothetical protein